MPQWFYKYKVYHLLFWSVYHFTWWAIAMGSLTEAVNGILFSPYTTKFVFYVVFQALGVYFNLYYLIPKFLEKAKYKVYLALLLITIAITALCITSGYYAASLITQIPYKELFPTNPDSFWDLFKSGPLSSTIASMTLAMSIKLGKNWIQTRKREQLLEKEKVETELKFLKSQFNPHFLFNTINSIFVLIHKNPDKASESLANFSDLLRYQLYECNGSKIPLQSELNYLQNFIDLGSLRLDKSVQLDFSIDDPSDSNLEIAPFILMPFVENAFKHVSQTQSQNNWLTIQLKIEQENLVLEVANSVSEIVQSSEKVPENKGIGLVNVKRRLELIYPNQYQLQINKDTNSFDLLLVITLNKISKEKQVTTEFSFQS